MKKQLFSLVMMLALVIVAGSAMAQTNNTPYRGGTYNYSLGGIIVNADGNAKIEYVGTAPTGWTIDAVQGETDAATYTLGDNIPITAGGTRTLAFKIIYSNAATTGKIKVTVTDGATAGCSNFIEFLITPQAKPDMTYAIVSSVPDLCQNINATPLDDNAAASGLTAGATDTPSATDNSFTFTVTPVVTNVTTAFSYTYTLALPNLTATLGTYTITPAAGNNGVYNPTTGKVDGTGTTAADATADIYTISFKTTTGIAPVDIEGALSAGSLTVTSGGQTYDATTTVGGSLTKTVSVKTMPSIGQFTIE